MNTYLVICGNSSAAVVIDPGAAASEVVPQIHDEGLDLHAILLTHAHLDHIEGVSEIRAISPDVPIWLHADDQELYEVAPVQAQMFGMTAPPHPPPTGFFPAAEGLRDLVMLFPGGSGLIIYSHVISRRVMPYRIKSCYIKAVIPVSKKLI